MANEITAPSVKAKLWEELGERARGLQERGLKQLFADRPDRAERLSVEGAGIFLDFSKHLVDEETVALLCRLAAASGLKERIEAMFRGEPINSSERRPVLHVALRAPRDGAIYVGGRNVVEEVHAVRERCAQLAAAIRSRSLLGFTGQPIERVINIGIGGSHLGPAMACEALSPFADPSLSLGFVSNIDGADLEAALAASDPASTLFIVCSKSWRTQETLVNATAARNWLIERLGTPEAVANHFVAVSTNLQAVGEFGIPQERIFPMWDWVGGRYSLPSAVGLILMVAIGPERFEELLGGYREVDLHFREAPFQENLPVLLGLLAVYAVDVLGCQSRAILPYAARLAQFPAYLQQLEMESNGKRVTLDGKPVERPTGAVVWGAPGTNGQHAFYQLLHQGTQPVPCDLIGFLEPLSSYADQHDLLLSNLIAQGEALAFGRDEQRLREEGADPEQIPHRVCPGNRPTTTILLPRLDPRNLGRLIALYEHSVFTQGVVFGIDSFDQWGVELGKVLASKIASELAAEEPALDHDPSTNALIRRVRAARGRP